MAEGAVSQQPSQQMGDYILLHQRCRGGLGGAAWIRDQGSRSVLL